MKKIIILLIRVYQKIFSPLKPPCCKFYPTCSTYTIQAIIRFGLLKGLLLSIKRILSCHPWSYGGYDPVPPDWPGLKDVFSVRRS